MTLSERISKLRIVRPTFHNKEIYPSKLIDMQEMIVELAKHVEEQEHRIEMLERRMGH